MGEHLDHLCSITLGDGYIEVAVSILRAWGEWKRIGPGPLVAAPGLGLSSRDLFNYLNWSLPGVICSTVFFCQLKEMIFQQAS